MPLFVDRAASVSAICCARRLSSATIPAVCSLCPGSPLSDCNEVLAPILGAADMRKYTEFGNLCINLDVRSLVTAVHESHCWYCGDGNVDDDEQCDAGNSADECASAPCQNGGVCLDGHGEYHASVARASQAKLASERSPLLSVTTTNADCDAMLVHTHRSWDARVRVPVQLQRRRPRRAERGRPTASRTARWRCTARRCRRWRARRSR